MNKSIIVILLSLVLILMTLSCSKKRDNTSDTAGNGNIGITNEVPDGTTEKKQHDTPKPALVTSGKYAFGDFTLTVTDAQNGISYLEYTDEVPVSYSDSFEQDNVMVKRIYSVFLNSRESGSTVEIDDNGNKFTRSEFRGSNYELYMHTEITGDGSKAYVDAEKARLKAELDGGKLSESMYNKYISILLGEKILSESGALIKVCIINYLDSEPVIYEISSDSDGDGKNDKGVEISYSSDKLSLKRYDPYKLQNLTYSSEGSKLYESYSVKNENKYTVSFEKHWNKSGTMIEYTEYNKNGKNSISKCYYESGKLKSLTEYNENGRKSIFKSYYESGNLKSLTEYYESGYTKSVTELEDNTSCIPKMTYYIDKQSKPAMSGETIDVKDFLNDFSGYWMSSNEWAVISSVDDMPYLGLMYGGRERCMFIDKILIENGIYTIGLKFDPYSNFAQTVKIRFDKGKLQIIEGNLPAATLTFDPDRTHLGDYPEDLTEIPLDELQKFEGSWTEIYHHGYHFSIIKTEDGYIYRAGIWETDNVFSGKIEKLYKDGNKYVLAIKSETYCTISGTIRIGSIFEEYFYDIQDGTYELLSAPTYPPEEHAAFMKHPLIQHNNVGQFGNPFPNEVPSIITADEMTKVLKGRWSNESGSIIIEKTNSKPSITVNGKQFFIDDLLYRDKYQVFILTLTDDNGDSYTKYFKINMTYDEITWYESDTNEPTFYKFEASI